MDFERDDEDDDANKFKDFRMEYLRRVVFLRVIVPFRCLGAQLEGLSSSWGGKKAVVVDQIKDKGLGDCARLVCRTSCVQLAHTNRLEILLILKGLFVRLIYD